MENYETIIRAFNSLSGKSFRFSKKENKEAVEENVLPYWGENYAQLRIHMRDYLKTADKNDEKLFIKWTESYAEAYGPKDEPFPADEEVDAEIDAEEKNESPAKAESELPFVMNTGEAVNTAMKLLATTMADILSKTQTDAIESRIEQSLNGRVEKYITEKYGDIKRSSIVKIQDKEVTLDEVLHERFMDTLRWIQYGFDVYMPGPAGSGKGYLARQIAKALGLEFHCSAKIAYEHEVMGFIDAGGAYHETEFYKAYTQGGLFFLDEMDASDPVALNALNGALADGICAFPCGKFEKHKDFHCIAAGNTYGKGATMEYVGRNPIDDATMNRFAVIEIDYDKNIEKAKAGDDTELLEFCRSFRAACIDAGVLKIVSYRDIDRVHVYTSQTLDRKGALKMGLLGGMNKDTMNNIANMMKISESNEFYVAFRSLIKEA